MAERTLRVRCQAVVVAAAVFLPSRQTSGGGSRLLRVRDLPSPRGKAPIALPDRVIVRRGLLAGEKVQGSERSRAEPSGAERAERSPGSRAERAEPSGAVRSRAEPSGAELRSARSAMIYVILHYIVHYMHKLGSLQHCI